MTIVAMHFGLRGMSEATWHANACFSLDSGARKVWGDGPPHAYESQETPPTPPTIASYKNDDEVISTPLCLLGVTEPIIAPS